ncbi:MAG: hypothetical protein NT007_05140 [Candidatus Kapabacteria bacterium]|nr:hypothetical protein [Candidatus Kapabacteria bacterium]
MTINSVQDAQAVSAEKRALTVQMEIQKDVLKDTVQSDTNKQLMQTLASAQPVVQVQNTAKNHISKNKVDIKI